MTNRIVPLLAALLCSGVILSPAASAQTAAPVETRIIVHHHDLDLETVRGQTQLDRRLIRAARRVCRAGDVMTVSRLPSREARECFEQVMARYQPRVAAIVADRQRGG
ncbi:UrcA family protein [Aurantiacibacter luteus]|uniref:UrcA family protein n=1 Tax=Aurantiacibacter luteus TaxID=1581420 RepID=A0A0G9MYF5_9SPHN|nr:UrcA family protein [Aurantiacibacter luteus]KLE34303.1 hypothetical protein AAW00_08630 [Aurantiacibacter luteus]